MDISLSNEHRLSTRDKLYLCKNIMIFKKSQVENQIFLQALFSTIRTICDPYFHSIRKPSFLKKFKQIIFFYLTLFSKVNIQLNMN